MEKENDYLGYRDSYETPKQSDFILPEEVEKAMNFKYSQEVLDHFLQTLPLKRDLTWYKENDFIFIPGPPEIYSMDKIVSIEPELFLFEQDQIKETCNMHHFSTATSWIVIKKKDLINQRPYKQIQYSGKCSCPSPAVLAWVMLVYKRTRNISLFKGLNILTSPFISTGHGCRTRIVFSWNDSNRIEIKQTEREHTPVDATWMIDFSPLISLEENDDSPF